MANSKTAKLNLVIAGDNKGAVKAVDQLGGSVGRLQGKLGGLGAGLAGVVSVTAITAAGKAALDGYEKQAGAVAKIKRLTGESAEDASLLAFAAQQSGVDAEKAATGWTIFAQRVSQGKVAAAGIATKDSNGDLLDFDQILGNVADKYNKLNSFDKVDLLKDLFGKGGADIGKILSKGSAGLEELRSKMQELGLEFDQDGLDKFQRYVQAQRDWQATLTGLEVQVGEKVVPVITALTNGYNSLNGPAKTAVTVTGGLVAATTGLAVALGALKPAFDRGLVALHLKAEAEVEAAAATGVHATAEEAAAAAAASEAAATQALTAALLAGGTAEAEFAAAAAAQATASGAAAAATEAQAAATAGSATSAGAATSALGPLALAIGAVVVAYKAYQEIKSGGESFDIDVSDALKATNAELLKGAQAVVAVGGGQKEFAEAGRQSIDVLYATRDAAKAQGVVLPGLAEAIKQVEGENKRAADRQGEYTDETEGSTDAVEGLTSSTKQYISVQQRVADTVSNSLDSSAKLTDAYTAHDDAAQAVTEANRDLADAEADVGEAVAQAAEDRRSATDAVVDAEGKVRDALGSVQDAQRSLNQERVDAVQRIKDLEQAEREAATAAVDAAHKVKVAEAERRRVRADPKSTALDREGADIAVRQARDDATAATEDATQAERDATEAKRRGVEGDEGVVRAREAVAEANKGVTDAEHDLAKARENVGRVEKESAAKIVEARAQVREAQEKSRQATVKEAEAWGDLVSKQFGAVAGAQAYRDRLKEIAADLDPSSPLATRIARLLADIDRAIELGRQQAGSTTTPPTRDPDSGPRRPGSSLNRSTGGGLGQVTVNVYPQGTTRSNARAAGVATGREVDRIARGTR